jgi:hypothetical protein
MRFTRTAVALVAIAASVVVLTGPAQAATPPTFKSCTLLNAAYPTGVARNDAASVAVQALGYRVPAVGAGIYKKNAARLDKDHDGVLCAAKVALAVPAPAAGESVVYLPTGLILADVLYGGQVQQGTLNAAQARFPFIWTRTLGSTNWLGICLAWTGLPFRDSFVNGVLTSDNLAKMSLSDQEQWAKDAARMLTPIYCTSKGFTYTF